MEKFGWTKRLKFRSGRQTTTINPYADPANLGFRFDKRSVTTMTDVYFKADEDPDLYTIAVEPVKRDLAEAISLTVEPNDELDFAYTLLSPFTKRKPLKKKDHRKTNDYIISHRRKM